MGNANSTSTDRSQKPSNENNIYRLAVQQSAVLGSLYDAKDDRLLPNSSLKIPQKSIASQGATASPTINTGHLKNKSLLSLTGIDQELCLSVCIKIISSRGVASLFNSLFLINEHTRFLSFYYPTRQSYITDERVVNKPKDIRLFLANIQTTHVITRIQYGMHVVVIIQLSPLHVSDLDRLLEKIQRQLAANTYSIEPNEEHLLDQFTTISVFSNIPSIEKLTKLDDVCEKIVFMQVDMSQHLPIQYTLRPIRSLCSWYSVDKARYIPLNDTLMHKIESYLNAMLLVRKQLTISLVVEVERLIIEHFKQQYGDIQQEKSKIEQTYQKRINRFRHLVLKIRSGEIGQDASEEPLVGTDDMILLKESNSLIKQLDVLTERAQVIENLKKQGIEYWNVHQLITKDDNNLKIIEQKLMKKRKKKRIFCYSDDLKQQSLEKWNEHLQELTAEGKTNNIVYADFSYCSFQLPQMKILSAVGPNGERKSSWGELILDATGPLSKRQRLDDLNSSADEIPNILLLGESSAGKSTFINALVNYLKYDTLEQARAGKPIALMPVSFLLTIGDQFDERIVKFGKADPNEDHHHPGQSVTQYCRSYVFSLNEHTKIRLIDTPGMGDTRGSDQDDRNMQHILSFINNLSHLTAVCILLKPNESRLNVVFRSYFTRLIGFLGEDIRDNIIFCFTNTRTTFFAPGNTAPLLKKMLQSYSIKDVPFTKANTFCFDSESFRYLIAEQKGTEFDDYQKEEYKRSWETSEKESIRLLVYIFNNLTSHPQKDWQSIEHALFQINQMTRPILETMRNTMRNVISLENLSAKPLIQLHPSAGARNSTICLKCERTPVLLGEFWVLPDEPHILSDRCDTCSCTFVQHSKVNYVLKYEPWNDKRKPSINEIKANRDRLRQIILAFAEFFKYVVRISKENDPLLSGFQRLINEEKSIQLQKPGNGLNPQLYDELKTLKKEYADTWGTSIPNPKPVPLTEVYKLLKSVCKDSTISDQMNIIKQTQELQMNEQEKQVS